MMETECGDSVQVDPGGSLIIYDKLDVSAMKYILARGQWDRVERIKEACKCCGRS